MIVEPTVTVRISSPPTRKVRAPRVKKEKAVSISATKKTQPIAPVTTRKRKIDDNDSAAAKKPKVKVTAVKKASKAVKVPKAPKVKTPKVKALAKPKRKPAFKLPQEANIYLDAAMRGRVTRAMKQKMFVISRELDPHDDSCETFEVLGSIGNNYTVTIGHSSKCTCMDYAIRKTLCKHILMVLLKVYRLPYDSPMFQRNQTSRNERLEARSTGRQVDPSILIPAHIRQKILRLTNPNHPDLQNEQDEKEDNTKRRSLDTSDCPVCFEEFEESKISDIDYCKVCGNNIHKDCFKMWMNSKNDRSSVSCVYCRSAWVFDGSKANPSGKTSVKNLDPKHIHERYYANFADELQIERKRDHSTYKTYNGYPFANAEFEE